MKKGTYLIIAILLYSTTYLNAQVISTIAGGMAFGYSGDGGPGTDALLYNPMGITADGFGNVYFGDSRNFCVRKIDASGIITTIAGNGVFGSALRNVSATSTPLYYPQAVATDTAGNVYICDNDYKISKVTVATGIITTVAGNGVYGFSGDGGPATAAQLGNTTGVAVDNSGNVYISDYANHRVRKVDVSGVITTIAGNRYNDDSGDGGPAIAASFREIFGIAVSSIGEVYITDGKSHCIRKIDKDGKISTVAGNHVGSGTYTGGFAGDGGPASAAQLNYPKYINLDKSDNLYIADNLNYRLRKVDALTGTITTIAGNGIPGYNGDGNDPVSRELYNPMGVVVDLNGKIYIVDKNNNRIRSITSTVSVKEEKTVGIGICLFPNPAKDELILRIERERFSTFSIVNNIGQKLLEQTINSTETRVGIQLLPAGVYSIVINGKGGVQTLMFEKSL